MRSSPDGDIVEISQVGSAEPRLVLKKQTIEIASGQVCIRADDGNRTRVFSLGSASRLNASCLRVGCFAWSGPGSGSPVVVRCCAVLHPVERCSRHDLGTPDYFANDLCRGREDASVGADADQLFEVPGVQMSISPPLRRTGRSRWEPVKTSSDFAHPPVYASSSAHDGGP